MLKPIFLTLVAIAVGVASATTFLAKRRAARPGQIAMAGATEHFCTTTSFRGTEMIVCRVDLRRHAIKLLLADETGHAFGGFGALADWLAGRGERLLLATNGGMYHEDRSPVGLFVADGKKLADISTRDGFGNFHMKPNGVFWIATDADGQRRAGVEETGAYVAAARTVDLATQSGPMLLVGGALHPRFIPGSDSLNTRNGIGTLDEGRTVVMAISKTPVNFHDFASFFQGPLGIRDALYLDGSVSSLIAPADGIRIAPDGIGPILAVTEPLGQREP